MGKKEDEETGVVGEHGVVKTNQVSASRIPNKGKG
jgi:hypothetical protein